MSMYNLHINFHTPRHSNSSVTIINHLVTILTHTVISYYD